MKPFTVNTGGSLLLAGLSALLIGCSPVTDDATEDSVSLQAVETESVLEPEPLQTINSTQPSLVPAEFAVPTLVEGSGFKVVPLGPELVKIDFDAYMSSIEHLQQTFTRSTSWPRADITDAEAMLDMETEARRFENRESFAYAVLTEDGLRERGCVYVRPSTKAGYDAQVLLWVTKAEFDAGFDEELYAWVTQWVEETWPFQEVAYPGRAIEWSLWDELPDASAAQAAGETLLAQNMQTANGMIDAFYSFDPEQLQPYLAHAGESEQAILYYQGWAEGGNYKVLDRKACVAESPELIHCSITVQDDPVLALQTGFNVTDTFSISFEQSRIKSVETSSDDQPIYYEAREWVEENLPEVMTGPCLDRSEGGTTPGDCARAMTEGYRQFYAAKVANATPGE